MFGIYTYDGDFYTITGRHNTEVKVFGIVDNMVNVSVTLSNTATIDGKMKLNEFIDMMKIGVKA